MSDFAEQPLAGPQPALHGPPRRALMLAAGVGRRLGGGDEALPKCLLSFGGRTLLERHAAILARCGFEELVLAVGHRAELVREAAARLSTPPAIRTVLNADYRRGSVLSLWTLRQELAAPAGVLLMDADVLCDRRMVERLLRSPHANAFLMDRDLEPGDEPVRICLRKGRPVEFRKAAEGEFDLCGESVGFFRLSAAAARALALSCQAYVDEGRLDEPCEEALRDLVVAGELPFGVEDVTGVPWIEIDFPGDIERAERQVLPRLVE